MAFSFSRLSVKPANYLHKSELVDIRAFIVSQQATGESIPPLNKHTVFALGAQWKTTRTLQKSGHKCKLLGRELLLLM